MTQNNSINRREFIKIVGITAATGTASLYGCGKPNGNSVSATGSSATAGG